MLKIKALPLIWWFRFYGQLTIPLSLLLIIICWICLSYVGVFLAISVDIALYATTIYLYKVRTLKELNEMLCKLLLYMREARRWKEQGIEQMEQQLNYEVEIMMIMIGRRFGYEIFDYYIEYVRKKDGVKLDEIPLDKEKKD